MYRPLQVGITGSIGAGKSLVCRIFQCLGVLVYDADSRAKDLMATDAILVEQIKKEFSQLAYRPDGTLDRVYLSKVTFGYQERLEKLNNLVHPRVAFDYQKWWRAHQNSKYLLKEAALLYEAGSYKTVDKIIVVTAPESIRISRIMARDPHRSQEDIKAIMKSQWPEAEKLKRADYVVYNDQRMLIPQVLHLHSEFTL